MSAFCVFGMTEPLAELTSLTGVQKKFTAGICVGSALGLLETKSLC
nr:hypothetical protein [Alcaligenes faecalis]